MDRGSLVYPKHSFDPEDLLTFVELRPFTRRWSSLDLDTDDLLALQIAIMCDPSGPPIIPGTGGLRKLRFAPPHWNTGKRGALRVCFAFFEEHKKVLLAIVYGKNEKDSLTQAEKQQIKKLLAAVEKEFDGR
jgi:hypothetical protein